MKCTRFLEWLESHDDEDRDGKDWETLDAHSRSCPDCRLDLARRQIIRSAIGAMPDVKIPSGLPKIIGQHLDLAGDDDSPPSLIERWFEWSIKPIATGLSFACVLMVAGLLTAGRSDPRAPISPSVYATAPGTAQTRGSPSSGQTVEKARAGETLVRLTPEEISDFRRKLADYRRQHPEMGPSEAPLPETALVGFQRP